VALVSSVLSSACAELVFRTPVTSHYFFGYYDKSPLNRASTRLLAMRVPFMDRLPTESDVATVECVDLDHGTAREITSTNAFNWQQGAMLQWVGPTFDRQIIFNRRLPDGFRAVLCDMDSGHERILDAPVYAVSPKGDTALTVDFERHYWCRRAYSYDGIRNPDKNKPVVPGDGIWSLDLHRNVSRQVVFIEQLIDIKPLASMRRATHYVEHVTFSPNGDSFAFYHRWRLDGGGIYARLYVQHGPDGDPELLHDSGRLNHYCWLDNRRILAGGGRQTVFNALRKSEMLTRAVVKPLLPLYKRWIKGNAIDGHSSISRKMTGDGYFVLEVHTGVTNAVFGNSIDRDGHPSPVPGKPSWIITDTYPDKTGIARVILGDLNSQQAVVLARLRSITQYDNSALRCDLHPKVSHDGKFVCVDTMNDGVRSMYLYRLPDEMSPALTTP